MKLILAAAILALGCATAHAQSDGPIASGGVVITGQRDVGVGYGSFALTTGAPASVPVSLTLPHTYTLADLDRMRAAITARAEAESITEWRRKLAQCHGSDCILISGPTVSDQSIELRLQTDILAGITPDELEAEAKKGGK
jgi:hypothetical protein